MTAFVLATIVGFLLLLWSADRFVAGASSAARLLGMSPLLIGMLILGFGTSAPELIVSALAASDGNPDLALGNAYGSNIMNIAVILGLTALIKPVTVRSGVLKAELPLLTLITLLAGWQLLDDQVTRPEAATLLVVFVGLIVWSIRQSRRGEIDTLATELDGEFEQTAAMPGGRAVFWLVAGLLVLIGSARLLVWGAVGIASSLGVSDLVIGLTVVAIGTSLPELAASIAATRRSEPDLAVGNIIGSNLFNTLAVVGIAGTIDPIRVGEGMLARDWPVMLALTVSLFIAGYGFRGRKGRINRFEGGVLVVAYVAYLAVLLIQVF